MPTSTNHRPRSARPAAFRLAACVACTLLPAVARADVEWHGDLATAHAAAKISRRPVLAVFVAPWTTDADGTTLPCLESPEAEAVLAACFEPVRIDVEEQAALTRSAGITHVPTACVLSTDDAVVARFEMPSTPAAFVSAALLAARDAAETMPDARSASRGRVTRSTADAEAPEPLSAATAEAFGSASTAAAPAVRNPRGSMARVTAKVRDLSAFAAGQSRPAVAAAPVSIASTAQRISVERPATVSPLSWPAEAAVAPPTAPSAMEPAALTPTTVAPWLDAPPQPAPPQPAAPQPPATAALAPAPAVPSPAAPAFTQPLPVPAAPPQQPGLASTLQKPFSLFGKPAVAEPPTMPPALPRNPLAAAAPVAAAPVAPQSASADDQRAMPLGLEGYCPVTLVDRGTWQEGRAQWGARHRGRTYLFAGPDEQRTFLADPDRYAPALSGDDPVLALDRGASTPGERRHGVTYQARIYLFATAETRAAFTADPARYTARVRMAEQAPAANPATRTY